MAHASRSCFLDRPATHRGSLPQTRKVSEGNRLREERTAEVRLIASPQNWIEGSAVQQLEKTATLPGMRLVVGLPDLHPGKYSPIGAAFAVEGRVYPTLVGNDIGCGIGLWRTELSSKAIKREAWADRLRNLDGPWPGDTSSFLEERGIEISGYEHSLGTIGGGNHFAELQVIDQIAGSESHGLARESIYLCVHSGSRGLGESILREHTDRHGAEGLAIGSPDADRYIQRHDHARRWAVANRELVAARILERLRTGGKRVLDICHNHVEPRTVGECACWLHRKGAAPSTDGLVLIPGSRGAMSYVVAPVIYGSRPSRDGGELHAFSIAHGAGRKWSRSECRARLEKRFPAKSLARTELGSQVICEDKELLYEEAPQAYKNISIVIDDLVKAGLIDVVATLRPVVTYKVRR
jgi:release factor H-coupled RctB family protein